MQAWAEHYITLRQLHVGPATASGCLSMSAMAEAACAQPQLDLGKREFEATCAACHGVDGKGSGPVAEQLKSRLPDLPYNQAAFVRCRMVALLAYMNQLQVK